MLVVADAKNGGDGDAIQEVLQASGGLGRYFPARRATSGGRRAGFLYTLVGKAIGGNLIVGHFALLSFHGCAQCIVECIGKNGSIVTGVRCGYTIVPKELHAFTLSGERVALNRLWNRRQCTKFNGTSYITQRGAEAVYSAAGKRQIKETIQYYMTNARIMKEGLRNCGLTVYGGDNAPYLWLKTPDNLSSWKFFDKLLYEVKIVGTPGVGFGPSGEGYLRLTAFGDRDDTIEAMERLRKWIR